MAPSQSKRPGVRTVDSGTTVSTRTSISTDMATLPQKTACHPNAS
jgi:hypothetical protein